MTSAPGLFRLSGQFWIGSCEKKLLLLSLKLFQLKVKAFFGVYLIAAATSTATSMASASHKRIHVQGIVLIPSLIKLYLWQGWHFVTQIMVWPSNSSSNARGVCQVGGKESNWTRPTCCSVTLRSLDMSALSEEDKYFFVSNIFSSSKIWRPVKVVRTFFFLGSSESSFELMFSSNFEQIEDSFFLFSPRFFDAAVESPGMMKQ